MNAVIRGQTVPWDDLSLLAFILREQDLLPPSLSPSSSSQPRISLGVRPFRALSFRSSSFKFKRLVVISRQHAPRGCFLFFSLVNSSSTHTYYIHDALLLVLPLFSDHRALSFCFYENPLTANTFSTADLSKRKRKRREYFTEIKS